MSDSVHRNVLLVEDHAPNVMVATAMLDTLGYSYLVAADGTEGVQQFEQGKFDLILMDIHMPSMGGIETTEHIRSFEQRLGLPRTPIIVMTAYIASADMNKCVKAGIDDIIPKPFHPDYFSKTLSRYIKKQAA